MLIPKVGAAGFEPATSWSQTRRDDRTTLRPEHILKFHQKSDASDLIYLRFQFFLHFDAVGAGLPSVLFASLRVEPYGFSSLHLHFVAVGAGFEPAVQLPVRQFSKLLVSASHPSHLCSMNGRQK